MKNLLTIMSLLFAGSLFAGPLHLDLEMTSEEYQLLLKKMDQKNKGLSADDPAIAEAIRLGEKLSHWIKLINEARRPEQAIRLTSAATRRGIPIDQPNMYSPSIIKTETVRILGQLPNSMKEVLLSRSDAPATTGMDDETFIKYARLVDRNYQSAARYRGVDQYRAEYIKAANYDVRGYYYLTKNNIGEDELQDVNKIEPNRLNLIQNALVQLCQNSNHQLSRCRTEVKKALAKNKLAGVYHRYINGAKRVWGDFFRIPTFAIRQDVSWSSSSAVVPFNTPEIPKFIPYLQNNIEDEFRWGSWKLRLNFGRFPNGPLLKFEPGVVPHVNDLGGNQIVMDSNQPIEEYESQWTIRHEFGHIIGLPDCYHEFYDVEARAYVNYQLDTTDLMCSRAGNMNERIYLELKAAYER